MSGPLSSLDPSRAGLPAKAEQSNRSRHSIWTIVLGILLGVALQIRGIRLPPLTLPLIIQVVLGFLLSVWLHEFGHAMAAAAVRMRLYTVAVWPFVFERSGSGWNARLQFTHAGYVGAYPVNRLHLRRRNIILTAGGPIASLIGAVTCFSIGHSALLYSTGFFCLVALCGGFAGARRGKPANDGIRILTFLKGGMECDQLLAQCVLFGDSMSGVTPGEMDYELLQVALGPADGSVARLAGECFLYNYLIQSGRIDEAEQTLATILSFALDPAVRKDWIYEAAWFLARHRCAPAAARLWFDAPGKTPELPSLVVARAKAEAAIAKAEGRSEDARRAVQTALAASPRLAQPGIAKAILWELAELS